MPQGVEVRVLSPVPKQIVPFVISRLKEEVYVTLRVVSDYKRDYLFCWLWKGLEPKVRSRFCAWAESVAEGVLLSPSYGMKNPGPRKIGWSGGAITYLGKENLRGAT